MDGELSKSSLENNKCYLLDCGAEVFVWVGRVTQLEERKAAIQTAEVELLNLHVSCLIWFLVAKWLIISPGISCLSK